MTTCPRCNQGEVLVRVISATMETIQVCDECEAVWQPDITPSRESFEQLTVMLKARGLSTLWTELAISDEQEPR